LEELGKFKKIINLIGSQTRDLLACSLVHQPQLYRVLQKPSWFSMKTIMVLHQAQ
jgi:hypothetical protein